MENKTCTETLERMINKHRVEFKNEIKNNDQNKIIELVDEIEALNHAISVLENLNPKAVIFI